MVALKIFGIVFFASVFIGLVVAAVYSSVKGIRNWLENKRTEWWDENAWSVRELKKDTEHRIFAILEYLNIELDYSPSRPRYVAVKRGKK